MRALWRAIKDAQATYDRPTHISRYRSTTLWLNAQGSWLLPAEGAHMLQSHHHSRAASNAGLRSARISLWRVAFIRLHFCFWKPGRASRMDVVTWRRHCWKVGDAVTTIWMQWLYRGRGQHQMCQHQHHGSHLRAPCAA